MYLRMAAIDIDGTLLDAEGRIPESAFRTFSQLASREIYVVIATGRGKESTLQALEENDHDPAQEGFPHALVVDDRIFLLDKEKREYVPCFEWNEAVEAFHQSHLKEVQEIIGKILARYEEAESVAEVNMSIGDVQNAKEAQRFALNYIEKAELSLLTVDRNRDYLSFRDSRLGKGNCLSWLSKELGVEKSNILTIGNSQNDESMLDGDHNFVPACPGNADPEIQQLVKKEGGKVADASYGEGVVEILEELMLENLERA